VRKLAIYGAAYLDVVKLVGAINARRPSYEIVGFIDDTPELQGAGVLGLPVLGGRERLPELAADPGLDVFNNVRGSWRNCRLIADRLAEAGLRTISLVHPGVDLAHVEIGDGVTAGDGCVIGAMTRLGDHVTLRLGVTVSHDARLGDLVSIGPGAVIGSHVVLGHRVAVGAGATVITGIKVGEGAVVGAGSVVNRDVPPETTVVGVPARRVAGGEAQG
jgi:sugar O-acyltransferase (sialic acid O-acetyltransferase NeuD family)